MKVIILVLIKIICFHPNPITTGYLSFCQTPLSPHHLLIVVYCTSFSDTSLVPVRRIQPPVLSPPLSRSPPPFSAFHLMLIVGSCQHRPLHIRIPPKVTSAASSVAAIARVIVVVIVIAGVVVGLGIDGRPISVMLNLGVMARGEDARMVV